MSLDPFTQQIQKVERLTRQVELKVSQAEEETIAWPQTAEQVRVYVHPVLNAMFKDVEGDVGQLKQHQPEKRSLTFSWLLKRMASFAVLARFHPQVVRFRLRILGFMIQYWFYRLLPYLIALVLIILTVVFWEEITAFLSDLLAMLQALQVDYGF